MFRAAFLLTICVIFTIHANINTPSSMVDIKVSDKVPNNKECWERGGTPLLMCKSCPGSRGGVVKLARAKNQALSAYNFGYPFESLTKETPMKQLSREINNTLNDNRDAGKQSGTVYLQFNENDEEWVLNKQLDGCGVVHEMNCLQTVILSDESDYRRFDEMGCKEILGDLIIYNFRFISEDQYDYSALNRLERITGRLIIHGCVGDVDLTFNDLTELKSQEIFVGVPILQITKNKLYSISFPKLKTISDELVVIGDNVEYSSTIKMAKITVNRKLVNTTFVTHKMVKKPKEEEFVFKEGMTEKDLIAMGVDYRVTNYHGKQMKDHWLVYLVVCVLLLFAVIGFTIYSMKFRKKMNFDFDMNAILVKGPDEDEKGLSSKDESSHKK